MYLKRKVWAATLALLTALSLAAPTFAAETWTSELSVAGTFGQTEARSMLDLMNDFRTGDEAFYTGQDGSTVTSKGQPLVYSYALEEIAMQRAIEVALSFSHTRPDGTSCFTARASNGTGSSGENIAAGSSTANAAFTQWREDGEPYAGQGHRRNMLNTSFQTVGIGHVTLNGVHYWVQEFSRSADSLSATTPVDEARTMSVTLTAGRVESAGGLSANPDSISAQVGDAFAAPTVSASVKLSEVWPSRETVVTVLPQWTSQNPETVATDGQQWHALQAGNTSVSGAALGQSVSVPVSVIGSTPVPTQAAQIYGNSLSLLGDIGVNFYLTFPQELTADSNAYVTLNGNKVLISDAERSIIDASPDDDYYRFTASVAAKEMNDPVTLRVYKGDGTAYPLWNHDGIDCTHGYAYSVTDYIQKAREKYQTGALLTLVEAMSDYGSCAQTYFDYNPDAAAPLSNALASVTADSFQPYEPNVLQSQSSNLQYLNSNLTLESETTLRHFFQLNGGNIGDYAFTVDGKNAVPIIRDGLYCVEIPNIVAKRLNAAYAVRVYDQQGLCVVQIDNYSALSYCKAAFARQNDALQNLVKSMYLYQKAAEAYFDA